MPADVELSVTVTKKGDGADKVARDLKEAARDADNLDDNLKQVNRQLVEMKALAVLAAKEFQKTGDISPLKQIQKDQRQLQQVQKALKGAAEDAKTLAVEGERAAGAVKDIGEEGAKAAKGLVEEGAKAAKTLAGEGEKAATTLAKEGEKVAKSFSDAILEGAQGLPFGIGKAIEVGVANPEIGAAGAVLAAGLLAGASAAVVGATLAGTAAIGLAGGILLAAKDERVNRAWTAFGKEAGQDLQDASAVFVQPLVGAAQHVGDAFHETLPLIEKDFAALAPVVDHLGAGAAGLIRSLGPGLSNAIQAGAPILEKVFDELPALGASIGVFFDQLSQGAAGGGSALILTMQGLEFGIESLGIQLHAGADAFDLFSGSAVTLTEQLGGTGSVMHALTDPTLLLLLGHLVGLDDATKKTSTSTDDFFHKMQDAAAAAKAHAQAQRQMKMEIDEATNAIKNQIGSMLGLDGASDAFNRSVLNLKDSITQNGHTLNDHTAKGLANRDAVLQGVQAAEKLREEMINNGQSTAYANSVYDQNIQKLRGVYGNTKAAAAAVDELIGKYGDLSRMPNIAKTITLTERFVTVGQRSAAGNIGTGGHGFQGAFFDLGGPVKAPAGQPVPAIVHGGEYVLSRDMLAGRQPITGLPTPARAPLAMPGGGGGGGTTVVEFRSSGSSVDDFIVELIRRAAQNRGGGNVQLAFGRAN